MKAENSRNFISSLQAVSITQNVYLSKISESQFKIISDRDKKNINTEDVATIAAECFEVLKTNTSDLGKLVSALRSYKQRVYTSKPWHLRLAAFFGCKSSAEKRIDALIQNALKIVRKNDRFAANFYSQDILSARSVFHKRDDKTLMKLFYHKVLDSKTSRSKLDGNPFHTSIASLLEDLIRYETHSSYFSQPRSSLIEEFHFALLLERQRTLNRSVFSNCPEYIVRRINDLPEKIDDVRHAVLIPGGNRSHAILYVVERAHDGSFTFKVINTGSGSTKTPIMVDSSGQWYMPKENSIVDTKYTSLTTQQLSVAFFDRLLCFSFFKNMSEVNKFIHDKLAKPDLSNIQIAREHKPQKNGTCSVKCLLTYIRERLGKTEYRKFRLWMTEQEIQRFDEVRKRKPRNWSEKELLEMKQEAQSVLQKCKAKVVD